MNPQANAQVREWLDIMAPTSTPDWYLWLECGAPTVSETVAQILEAVS